MNLFSIRSKNEMVGIKVESGNIMEIESKGPWVTSHKREKTINK